MEVQLIEAPSLWVKPTGDELEQERSAFFAGKAEVDPERVDPTDEPDAPF